MRNRQYAKWLFWIILASVLTFGGLAFALTPGYGIIFKAYCRMGMFFGFIIWSILIFIFITKNLNK